MTVTRTDTNVVVGFADMWWANENTAEPSSVATLAEPAAGWTSIGFTGEGASWSLGKDVEMIRCEEQLTPVGAVITSIDAKVSMDLAEATAEAQLLAYGIGSLTTTATGTGQIGKKTITLGETLDYVALVIMVANPYGFRTRIYVPKAAATGTVDTPFKRAEKRIFPVEFSVMCAPSAVNIVHQTAAAS